VIDPACGSGHFLLGAARRMATRVAQIRNPDAPDYNAAMRDVVRSSIHGVDRNPMAVELTKVALWIETVEPGKPLGFLDANVRCGDSLLGVFDLAVLEKGVPDAAYKPLTGDDKEAAKLAGKVNRQQRDSKTRDLFGHADAADLAAAKAEVWIDFTTPEATLAALDALAATETRAAIVCTTGLSPEQEQQIAAHATRIAIVRSGNFSLGVNLLAALVEQAAAKLGEDWDIEIHEAHHRRKVDAPSGTALLLGEAAAKGRGAALADLRAAPHDGATGPRRHGAIGFSVTRAGGIVGEHDVRFASEREILTLSHHALDRAVFADGALAAALWVAHKPPGLYSMRDVLGL
jgi:4-hydroxy-tetrahydrodipicolinate reductase